MQRPEDVAKARKLIGSQAVLFSKLEKPGAIDFLDEIIELSDAVMVARGDLGVEVLPERLFPYCRNVSYGPSVGLANRVVATQMP